MSEKNSHPQNDLDGGHLIILCDLQVQVSLLSYWSEEVAPVDIVTGMASTARVPGVEMHCNLLVSRSLKGLRMLSYPYAVSYELVEYRLDNEPVF